MAHLAPPLAFPLGGTASAGSSDLAGEQSRLLGHDLWFDGDLQVTAAGDWLQVSGVAALRQSVLRRLITAPGEWATRPDYGVGVQDFIYEPFTASAQAELGNRIRTQLLQDRRIESVSTVIAEQPSLGIIIVRISVRASGQAIKFAPFVFPDEFPELLAA